MPVQALTRHVYWHMNPDECGPRQFPVFGRQLSSRLGALDAGQ
ncbi:hypothetical protein GCM10019017_47420 [Streptomyces showdoensis]